MPTPPIAWRPLSLVTGITAAVLFGLSGRYGYHRDELYYLVAGRHLAWGYDDQPPGVAVLAWLADELAGGHLMALRLPATLATAAIVLLTGLIARELGGASKAQTLAAIVMAVAPVIIIAGHLLSTTILDVFWWTVLAFLLVRFIRVPGNGPLLAAGPVIGLALLTKSLVVIFLVGLAAGLLIAGPREIFKRPALWLAAAIALAMWAPNLWWQATHDWPQLRMTAVIRDDADWGGQLFVVPMQILLMSAALAPIWLAGLWRLLRHPDARPYHAFGIAYLVALGLVLVTGGRMYYVVGAYPVLVAMGATQIWSRNYLRVAVAFSALWTVMQALPVFPVNTLASTPQPALNYDSGETVGWPELAATVATVYRGLPASEQSTAVILTSNYGQAGALDRYGRPLGLPEPYSRHLAFWRWGPPPETATGPVIVVGRWGEAELSPYCDSVELGARHDNGYGLDNDEQGVPIWVCRGLKRSWQEVWPLLRAP